MIDIDWSKQPTPDSLLMLEVETGHIYWVKEYLEHYSEVNGAHVFQKDWVKKGCYEVYSQKANIVKEMGYDTVEPEYIPKVGEWCEVKEAGGEKWIKAKIYGLADLPNEYVCKPKGYWYDDYKLEQIRPIKSDREVFIERAREINRGLRIGASEQEMLGALYDSGAVFADE